MLWAIIRCPPARTLQVSDQLKAKGLEVWSPTWVKRYRMTRSRKATYIQYPLLPSFIFVSLTSVRLLGNRVPDYPLLHMGGRRVHVPDVALDPLREFETQPDEVEHSNMPEPYAVGEVVLVKGGPFDGRKGKVLGISGQYNVIAVSGMRLIVLPLLLTKEWGKVPTQ